jgi:two-component system, cell cycle response regulator DivK
VLYIEDNHDNRKLVKRILQAEGFEVHGAIDGPSGLEQALNHIPDLVLMDIHLPGIDGYTMTQQIRTIDRLAHVPIIALTANVTQEDQEKSRAAGCDGFIQKPINVDSLPGQIRAYLSSRGVNRQPHE